MIERLLVVSLGASGKRHAAIARQLLPGARVTALRHTGCDGPFSEGIDGCVTTMDDALRGHPQAAVIASPSPFHLKSAIPLAVAGVHLLIEKPLADRLEGVERLQAAAHRSGCVVLVGYNLRFVSTLRRFRELIHSGRIGKVRSVYGEVGQYLPSWRPGTDYRKGVSAQASLGGGVLLELSHEIDYLRWIFGDVQSVSALLRRESELEIDVEDTAELDLNFAASASNDVLVAKLKMDFVRQESTRQCIVVGETGTLKWDGIRGTVEERIAGTTNWAELFSEKPESDASYVAEWKNFLECVETSATPEVTLSDGIEVVRIIEAAKLASSSGSLVRLGHVGIAQS